MDTKEQSEQKPLTVSIAILQNFVLNIETEKKFYEISLRGFMQEAKQLRERYKHSIEIEKFLQSVSTIDDVNLLQTAYKNFSDKKIDDQLTYGDVFSLDLEEVSQNKNIVYGIRFNKVNADLYFPSVGTTKLYQVSAALRKSGEKAIIGMVQVFEEYFERILRRLIFTKPEAYLYDKTISYDKLINVDLKQLQKDLINREVEKLMHGVCTTISKINTLHKLNLDKHKELWDSIIEIEEHRNIIVHNEGIINEQYLSNVPDKYKSSKIGEYIDCNKKCIELKATNLIKFGYLLMFLIGEDETDIGILEDTAFDFLKKEQWELAEFSYNLLLKLKSLKHEQKTIYEVNKLNAKKHLIGLEHTKEEIKKLDVSGMQEQYSIAKDLLLENNEIITEKLEKCYPLLYNSYLICTWPLFIEYRKTEEYKNFRERHREDFEPYNFN